MALVKKCAAWTDSNTDDDWRLAGCLAQDVVSQLRCVKSVPVAYTSSPQISEDITSSNELAGIWSVMELALDRDIASHGFA